MKKTAFLILLLALCLLVAPFAVAESGPVARSDTFAAYTDGEGHLYLPGRADAINEHAADSVVGIDAYRVLYLSPDDFLDTQDLYMVDLESFEESLIATDVRAACLAGEDDAYYVTGANRTQLSRVDLHSLTSQVVYTAAEPIDRLYMSAEGLIFQLVDQAATMLYVEETDRFEIYSGDIPRSGSIGERYEVFLTDGAELYMKSRFNYNTTLIDSDVTAYAWLNNTVYYLTRTGSALRLKAYDTGAQTSKVVLTPGVKMKDQLTASGKSLFMLAADNTVCRVDTAKGTLAVFKRYSDLSAYKLPAEYNVDGLRIEGMGGQLNVYAQLTEKAAKPTFSFIEFESESDVAAPVLRLIDTLKLSNEQTALDLLTPTPQYTALSRGSRGDAVRAIQQPLKDLGYYDYYVDGIFGPRTQAAVQLLQFDLDRTVTGIADAELQRIILSGKLSAYDPYRQLTRGNRGMRVRRMQERLRELGYLADAADGIFGPRTLKAVQLFQEENGLQESEAATRDTLKRLYSDRAEHCSSYIDLYPGDTGYRVRELNNRLKDLYYLECSPGSTYTSQTTSAVRVFQRTAGLRETGNASQAMQRLLFSDDAPEAPGYIVLRRGDDNERVARLQRRLKALNYYSGPVDGYFGRETKEAVALFQKKVGLKPTGVATVRTQMLLFSDDAPEYVEPTVIGTPDIYIEDYDYVDNGVYFISEASTPSGYVVFNWDAEGAVDHYNVRVSDSMGNVYADNDTLMTSTGVPLVTLDFDVVYTLRVTAYPEDGDSKHVTRAEVEFVRLDPIEEEKDVPIDTVGIPEISMDTVARVENGVNYLLPGTITFFWAAEGDVGIYEVTIEDESGDVIVDENMSELKASISSSSMNAGEIYTITVLAIPESGNRKAARSSTALFALPEIELPEPDPTPEPTPIPTPEPIEEAEELEIEEELDIPEEDLEPVATFEPTPEPEVVVEIEDDDDEEDMPEDQPLVPEALPEETTEKETDAPVNEVIPEETTEESTEVPANEVSPEEPEASEPADTPDAQAQSPTSIGEPSISLDYVEEVRDGVSYVSGDVLTMSWQADGDVAEYRIELLDSGNNTLDSRVVDTTSLSAHTSALAPDEVYTLKVTAIPAGGTDADGKTSASRFALYAAAPEAEVIAPVEDDGAEESEAWEQADEAWQSAEEEYQEPEEEHPEPEEEQQEPEEEYREPEEAQQEPEEEYREPEEAQQEPEEEYREPEEAQQEPEKEYREPEEYDQEPEDEIRESDEESTDSGDETIVKLTEEEIIELQDKLVALGWLESDSYTPGTLDEATLEALSRFQEYCNTTLEMELPVIDPLDATIDPLDPRIDARTLETLTSADERFMNPNPVSAEGIEENPVEDFDDEPDERFDEEPEEDFDDAPEDEGFEEEAGESFDDEPEDESASEGEDW